MLLAVRLSQAADPPTMPRPIGLSHFNLTLPIDAAGTVKGKAIEVLSADLTAGYRPLEYFLQEADGSLVFWCPVAGATTEGTEYPRTELREMHDPRRPQSELDLLGDACAERPLSGPGGDRKLLFPEVGLNADIDY